MATIYNNSILNIQPLELLDKSIGKSVHILTKVGIEFTGNLDGIDPAANCVLSNATEVNTLMEDRASRHHDMVLVNGGMISIIVPLANDDNNQ